MTIYLYVKTHTITGLKYLGKTIKKDPHEYPGSGTYWRRHLKVHGATYTTEILRECQTNDEVKTWGMHYSELWNVVGSDEWANLKPEAGDGGGMSLSSDSIAKSIETRRANDTLKRSPETIAKVLETKRARGNLNSNTLDSIAKMVETRRARGTLNPNTPESIARGLETKRKNGTLKPTPESIAKRKATWARKKSQVA